MRGGGEPIARCVALRVLVAAGALALVLPAAAMATPTAIRTGGPSEPGESKVAIVGSDKKLKSNSFSVIDDGGNEVLSGKLRKAKGKPAPWKRAYAADLSDVEAPGLYRVVVGNLESRAWEVKPDGSREAIDRILVYFQSNRDGYEPSPIHGFSHLNDAVIHPDSPVMPGASVDMTGGWMDAGDMIHFTQTTAFSTALLEASARLDPPSSAALYAEADVGLRWLIKAHPAPGVFIAQVGDDRDHEKGFRDPAEDDESSEPGIGVRNAYPEVGGDLGGKAAAALAMAYVRTGSPAYLTAAEEWYEAGVEADRAARPLRKAGYPKYAGNFYNSSNWKDSLAAGAAELYRASCESGVCDASYDADYATYAKSSQSEAYAAMGTVDDFSSFAAAEVCGAFPGGVAFSAESSQIGCDVLKQNGRIAVKQARKNAFGMPGYFTWGTTAQNGAAGALAALAASGPDGNPGGCKTAAGARDYLLGRNPFDSSMVTAYGPNSPRSPHHWAATFGNGLPQGAVVGGPAPRGQVKGQGFKATGPFNKGPIVYVDQRKNYVNSEPAIDYSASSILLLAALRGSC